MQRYIAFISGLPTGRNATRMETLCTLFSRLGFLDVESFLTTGNIAFRMAPVGLTGPLAAQISRHLRRSLDVKAIWTFIRSEEELARIVADVPFSREDVEAEGNSLFVVLLSEPPDEHAARQLRIRRNDVDELRLAGREIYWLRRPSEDPVPPPPVSEILDAHATVRSFHTISQLAARYAGDAHPARKKSDGGDFTESAQSRR